MSIQVRIDEQLRQVWVTVLPVPQTTTVAETILALTEQRPALGGWDWIIDTRNPHELATIEEIDRIAGAWNAVNSTQSHTIFISDSPSTYDRVALLGRKFRNRRHLVARSPSEARSLLPQTFDII